MTIHAPVINVPELDLSSNTPAKGDTTSFPPKMAGLIGQLEQENTNVRGTNTQIIAALAALSAAIEANTTAIVAARTGFHNDQFNALVDHGSFIEADGDAVGVTDNGSPFNNRCIANYMVGENGTDFSTATEAARYYKNSTTYGGVNDEVPAIAQQFVTAMAPADPQFLDPFVVGRIVVGSGTDNQGPPGYYRFCGTSRLFEAVSVEGRFSFAMWIRCVGAPIYIRGYPVDSIYQSYINGARVGDNGGISGFENYHAISTNQIAHVAFTFNPDGFDRYASLPIYVAPSSVLHMAALVGKPGAYQIHPHTSIIRSAPILSGI